MTKRNNKTGREKMGGGLGKVQRASKPPARRNSGGMPARKKKKFAPRQVTSPPVSAEVLERFEKLLYCARGPNPRARKKAVRKMLKMCGKNCPSLLQHYEAIGELCKDSDPSVRSNALKLLTLLAHTRPKKKMRNQRGHEVTYCEEAFTRVCTAMSDCEEGVRVVAAELMGRYTRVDYRFLSQTLFRRLIHSMKAGEDTSASNAPKWPQVQKLGSDIQMEGETELKQSTIPPGACGAFITALEDEFAFSLSAVRRAAIKSIGQLCTSRPEFMPQALDQFVDMFNDQLHDVRLAAIETLAPMISSFTIKAEQVEPILGVLDDRSADVRRGVVKVISQLKLDVASTVEDCCARLLTSMSRFPQDKPSIYRCLQSLGLGHGVLVEEVACTLLGIHPLFVYPEAPIDDEYYVGKLMLVLNAASSRSSISRLLPAHVKKQYRFLRYAYPDLVNPVQELESERRYPNISPQLFERLSATGKPLKTQSKLKSKLAEEGMDMKKRTTGIPDIMS